MEAHRIFAVTGAVLTGHFVYKSRRHGNMYVNKDKVYVFAGKFEKLCDHVASLVGDLGLDVVAGPAIGGWSSAR